MHEYSIVSSLMEQVTRELEKHAATRVRRVEVRIGEASGVEAELFVTAFQQLREGVFDQAELCVERVEARFSCGRCEREFCAGDVLLCESCGEPAALTAGGELMLDRIELEVGNV